MPNAALHLAPEPKPWNGLLSASQVSTFELCQRKWAFRYILGHKHPPNDAALLGTEVDKLLSEWLEHGTVFDASTHAGQIALSALPVLPKPKSPTLEVQAKFLLQLPSAKFVGYKDLQYVADVPVVEDHKTTSDFRWAKTEQQLRSDVQAMLYAADSMERFSAPQVRLRWNYYNTRKVQNPHVVQVQVDCAHVEERLALVDKIAAKIVYAYENKPPIEELPASVQACTAFGGCPFVSMCPLTGKERSHTMSTESLIAKMRAKQKVQSPSTETEAPQVESGHGDKINPPPLPQAAQQAASPPPPPPPVQMPLAVAEPKRLAASTSVVPHDPIQAMTSQMAAVISTKPTSAAPSVAPPTVADDMRVISDAASRLRQAGVGTQVTFTFSAHDTPF